MSAMPGLAASEWIEWPRIPVRGLLRYVWSGAVQVTTDDRAAGPDEDELRAIEGSKRGDPDAFDFLVRQYSRRVLSIVWNVLHDSAASEDVAQDAFVKAFETMGRFRSGERFGPWIYRIATNLAIDALRKRARRAEEPVDDEVAGRIAARPDDTDAIAARIDEALEALPDMQRVVARLFLVEELSHREIAEITGLAEGTVRSHLSHARRKLQESLADIYGGRS